jgi:hypothetical protein
MEPISERYVVWNVGRWTRSKHHTPSSELLLESFIIFEYKPSYGIIGSRTGCYEEQEYSLLNGFAITHREIGLTDQFWFKDLGVRTVQ